MLGTLESLNLEAHKSLNVLLRDQEALVFEHLVVRSTLHVESKVHLPSDFNPL